MKKVGLLSIFVAVSLWFPAFGASADVIVPSTIVPDALVAVDLLIIGGVVVGVMVLISWLAIRAIRNKEQCRQ